MSDTVMSLLIRRLEERKSSIEQFLAQGGAKSYEEYMSITGRYQAMSEIVEDAKEIEKRFLED